MASAKDIAVLERKLKEAKTNREKIVLAKELKDLKSKLSTTQKQDTLPTQRRKIRMLSSADFNELIARLKQRPEYSFLKSMGKKKIADDYRVVGKPVGWRIKGKDNYKVPSKRFRAENPDDVYYENRTNRSDVRRPNRLEQGGMMAKGGYVSKGEMVWKKLNDNEKLDFLYKNFTPEITPRTQEILRGKAWNFLPKNVKIKFESKYANVEDYATGGMMVKENILKEDDCVWNVIGKKLVVDKVTKDEYYLSGFGQIGASPFSKSKVNSYIKSGEWTLKPKMAKGGLLKKK